MKKLWLILMLVLIVVLLSFAMGLSMWKMGRDSDKKSQTESYRVVSLDDSVETIKSDAFVYTEAGFLDNSFTASYSCSFGLAFHISEQSEPFNITVSLVDTNNFLRNNATSITLEYYTKDGSEWIKTGDTITGTDKTISNITSSLDFQVKYTITTNASGFANIYSSLLSGETTSISASVSGDNLAMWSINKTIAMLAKKYLVLTWDYTSPFTYNAENVTVALNNSGIALPADVSVAYTNNTYRDAGSYTATGTVTFNEDKYAIKMSGEDVHSGDIKTLAWQINKAPLSISAENKEITYYDDVPSYTYVVSGLRGSDTLAGLNIEPNISCSYVKGNNAGSYDITIEQKITNNYQITYNNNELIVNPKVVGITWTNDTFTYDKTSHVPIATATGLIGSDTTTITVTGGETNAGSYTATASAISNGNYQLPLDGLTHGFTISPKEVVINWTNTDLIYNGSSQQPTATATNVISGDTVTITVTGGKTNVGNYTATASAISNNNYALPSEKTSPFTISKAALTIAANPCIITYYDNVPAYTGTYSTLKGTDAATLSFDCDYTKGSNVGSYTITPTINFISGLASNYDITVNTAILTVNNANLTNVSVAEVNEIFTGSAITPNPAKSATSLNSQTITWSYYITGDYLTTMPSATAMGTYTVHYKASAPNHNDSVGTFTFNIKYQISFNSGTHGTGTMASVLILSDTYTIPSSTFTANSGYVFDGWTATNATVNGNVLSNITGNVDVTATWRESFATVTIVSSDTSYGTVNVASISASPGDTVSINNNQLTINGTIVTATPATSTPRYEYSFVSWSVSNGYELTGDITITATFNRTLRKYIITWLNADGSTIDTTEVDYGETPTHADGTKAPTYMYQYTFNGWSPSISSVTGNATYTATYTSSLRSYNVSVYFKDRDNKVSAVMTNTSEATGTYGTQVYNFINQQGSITGTYVYGSTLNIYKQIQIEHTYTYYKDASTTANRYIYAFYVSPTNNFVWDHLAGGNNASTYTITNNTNYLIHAEGDNLTIIVLCVQAEAIVSTGSDSISASSSSVKYYASMNEAFDACRNPSTSTYLRVYGRANYASNNFSGNCLTSNNTINAYNFTYNDVTYTVAKHILYISDYNLSSNFEIKEKLSLIMPYARDIGTTQYTNKVTSNNAKSTAIHSIMTIPAGVTLTVNGTFVVGGIVFGSGATSVGAHAVLINNGTINLSSGKTITAYGYIKGTGLIDMASGSTIIDVMKIYNWPGGANALGMYNNNIFPFDCFSLHNVSCPVKINAGASYKAYTALYMSSSWATSSDMTIVGSGGLFKLNSGYCLKYVEDTTANTSINSYTTSNQLITQRDVVEMHGNFEDSSMSVTVKVIISKTISTSTSLAMPIGFMKIVVANGAVGNLTVNSYKFMPGSQLVIEEGGSLTIGNSSSHPTIVFYDNNTTVATEYSYKSSSDATAVSGAGNTYAYMKQHSAIYSSGTIIDGYEAKLVNNGTLNCSNAYLAGVATSTTSGSSLIVGYASVSFAELSALTYGKTGSSGSTTTKTYYPYGNLYSSSSNPSKLGVNTYVSEYIDGSYYWTSADDLFTLTYNANGGQLSGASVQTVRKDSNNQYTITSSTFIFDDPTRSYYTFDGWYLNSACTTPALGATISANTILYAKWVPVTYTINYNYIYDDCSTSGNLTNTSSTTFTNDTNGVLNTPTDGSLVFGGWFLDSNLTLSVSSIVLSDLTSYINFDNNTLQIYGVWYYSLQEWTVTFNNGINNQISISSITLTLSPNATSYSFNASTIKDSNNVLVNEDYEAENVDYPYYFIGWYTDSNYTNAYNGTITGNTTLYGKWNAKIKLIIQGKYNSAVVKTINKYTIPVDGLTFNLNDLLGTISGYRVSSWSVSGAGVTNNNGVVSIPNTPGLEVTMIATLVKQVTITRSDGTNGSHVTLNISVYSNSSATDLIETFNLSSGSRTIDENTYIKWSLDVDNSSSYQNPALKIGSSTPSQPYNVTGNTTLTVSCETKSSSCLLPNTLVTMADGSQKEIQYLVPGDMIMVFNHETGMLDIAPVTFNECEEAQWFNVIHLIFDTGADIGVISEHGFFDLDTMRYEYIDEHNYRDFIGHRFYTQDGTSTTLIDAYITEEYTMCYSLPTYYHLNLFVEGLLSMPGGITGLFNYFEYADNLQYDQDKMLEDINTYGLFTVEEFEPYGVTEEMFYAYAGQYLKVALGKGILTEEYLMYLVERYGKYTE